MIDASTVREPNVAEPADSHATGPQRPEAQQGPVRTAAPAFFAAGPRPLGGKPIIRSREFSLFYGPKVGVKRITMNIHPQSVTAIIGPSGCGKSTFLRSINRMNDLIPDVRTEGRLEVNGTNVYDRRINLPNLRQQVGMVFQKPNPFPKSIYDNVPTGGDSRGSATGGNWMKPLSGACVRQSFGMRSRTTCESRPWPSRAASSSACASRGRWPRNPRCC